MGLGLDFRKWKYGWVENLLNVKTAFVILIISIFIYLVVLDIEGAFTANFLHFGPTDTTFMRMKADSWDKVIMIYFIGFFSSVLISYYHHVSENFISKYIHNEDDKYRIKMSKGFVQTVYIVDQFIYKILVLLELFVNITLQLQFIIPGILGKLAVDIPHGFYLIEKNKYVKE
jgi:hypothetical protein